MKALIVVSLLIIFVSCGKDDSTAKPECKVFKSTWTKDDNTSVVNFESIEHGNGNSNNWGYVGSDACWFAMSTDASSNDDSGELSVGVIGGQPANCSLLNGVYNYERSCYGLEVVKISDESMTQWR